MKKRMVIIASFLITAIIILLFSEKTKSEESIVINEVCSRNGTLPIDVAHLGEDYIELYNTTEKSISLEGWWLSDDLENPKKHKLPNIEIAPKDFIVFFADGKGLTEQTLNFKISSSGEKILLSDSDGNIVDQVAVPELRMDEAYAREKDGKAEWTVLQASVGKSNSEALSVKQVSLNEPVFSHLSGFYDEEFELEIRAGRGQKIYYTLDGSVPTEKSLLYSGKIKVKDRSKQENVINGVQNIVADWKDYVPTTEKADKATVVRAVAMDEHDHKSDVVTETYLVELEIYKESPVLSIIAEPNELIGKNGIFVTGEEYDQWYLGNEMSKNGQYEYVWTDNYEMTNFWKHGRQSEVVAGMQLFENGEKVSEQEIGLRVQGNFVRLYDKKSLKIISRGVYSGSTLFEKTFFGDVKSHSVIASAVPEKAYCMDLAEGRNLGLQGTLPCALFINGEYWYTAILMETYDEEYFEQHYGVNSDNVLLVKDREAPIGENYYYLYEDLINYLRDDSFTQEEKAVVLYEQMDIQSIIDWLCFNLYLCNDDISYKKNSLSWRTIEPENSLYGDCKWRWLVYDIDHAATYVEPDSVDFSEFSIISDNRFYWALRTSEHFRKQFVLTAMDLINTNFKLENVNKVLAKWGLDSTYADSFFVKRPQYMIESLKNEFDLSGTVETVKLSINAAEAGNVYINTIQADMSEGEWEGQYFTDYPVKVTAQANPGYRFAGWSGSYESTDTEIRVAVEEGIQLTALFEKD